MYELLYENMQKKVALTQAEFETCLSFFTRQTLPRKAFLLREGEVCRYTAFVVRGVLRSYTIDEKGIEHVIQFAPEDWWIADMYSFLTAEPSTFAIDALEAVELLLITKAAQDEMVLAVPKMERYLRLLMQSHLVALQRRLMGSLNYTAEEKFEQLQATCPGIVQRVAQRQIASYLGITPETLSRIRRPAQSLQRRG